MKFSEENILDLISALKTLVNLAAKGWDSAEYSPEAISKLPLDKLD